MRWVLAKRSPCHAWAQHCCAAVLGLTLADGTVCTQHTNTICTTHTQGTHGFPETWGLPRRHYVAHVGIFVPSIS